VGYNADVTFEEAERLHVTGNYKQVLEEALREQSQAIMEGRKEDLVSWSYLAVLGCRDMGRVAEALTHARWAVDVAETLDNAPLLCLARYALALAHRSERDLENSIQQLRAALDVLPAGTCDPLRATVLLETAETCLEAGLKPEAEAALARGGALVHWLRSPRLLSWCLFLRSRWEVDAAADLQLSAAYEISRTVDCPELQWRILWRLAELAEKQNRARMGDEFLWNAFEILSKLVAPLDGGDAGAFWRQGPRRAFLDTIRTRFGGQFLQKAMQEGAPETENATAIIRDLGFDPASIPEFGRRRVAPQQ
jgi:tetratricopeptide (TPR) repeat protein